MQASNLDPLAAWGAFVSTSLAIVKLWETFWKDRLSLATSYSFDSRPEVDDTITIVNLSPIPVQVSDWSLRWVPRHWWVPASTIDVTPDDTYSFKIASRESYELVFGDMNKFDWSFRASNRRKLVLSLRIFGRRRPKLLTVKGDN